ncbi:hypothetical protein HJC10_40825 [Corallococcus exiguus]|nr:hypothetical protein [Corallococcus exiguus]
MEAAIAHAHRDVHHEQRVGQHSGLTTLDLLVVAGERAAGGPVRASQAHLVGELGPDLFIPSSSGRIVPNEALGGGEIAAPLPVGHARCRWPFPLVRLTQETDPEARVLPELELEHGLVRAALAGLSPALPWGRGEGGRGHARAA